MRWRRERNMRWTKFSDVDPDVVHAAFAPVRRHDGYDMRASPCTQMTLLGQGYGEPCDAQVNCVGCLGAEDFTDPDRPEEGYP